MNRSHAGILGTTAALLLALGPGAWAQSTDTSHGPSRQPGVASDTNSTAASGVQGPTTGTTRDVPGALAEKCPEFSKDPGVSASVDVAADNARGNDDATANTDVDVNPKDKEMIAECPDLRGHAGTSVGDAHAQGSITSDDSAGASAGISGDAGTRSGASSDVSAHSGASTRGGAIAMDCPEFSKDGGLSASAGAGANEARGGTSDGDTKGDVDVHAKGQDVIADCPDGSRAGTEMKDESGTAASPMTDPEPKGSGDIGIEGEVQRDPGDHRPGLDQPEAARGHGHGMHDRDNARQDR
jgi:hypothetical protein